METEHKGLYSFHLLLGKIFYAAAIADKVIKEDEIEKLNELLMDYWSDGYQEISDGFFRCVNGNYDTSVLMSEIKAHKEAYPNLFSNVVIDQIMKTAYKVVASFSGTNKSEVVFISQLRSTLEK